MSRAGRRLGVRTRDVELNPEYECLDAPQRVRFFSATDRIFDQLGLTLSLFDINPLECADDNERSSSIRRGLLEVLRLNDSFILPKEPTSDALQEGEFVRNTLAAESDVHEVVSSTMGDGVGDIDDRLDRAVRFVDEYRSVMLLLCPKLPLTTLRAPKARPLMGAAIGLTATDGEIEIRWAFSKLQALKFPSDLRTPLEALFIHRIVAESLFLEDLRVVRIGRRGFLLSPRTTRFVSIVCRNMVHFPKTMVEALVDYEGATRHYNIRDEDGVARHTIVCICRQRVLRQLQGKSEATKRAGGARQGQTAVGRLETIRKKKDLLLKSQDLDRVQLATIVLEQEERKLEAEVAQAREAGEPSQLFVWSFYGIPMAALDRQLQKLFAGQDPQVRGMLRDEFLSEELKELIRSRVKYAA